MNITALPRPDNGDVNVKLEEGQEGYDKFYEKPYEKIKVDGEGTV